MPDADMEMTTKIMADSAFGCAGQRCLAASVAVAVGEAQNSFIAMMAEVASRRKVGYGLDEETEMGPVISQESKARIESLIGKGSDEGAKVLLDGRDKKNSGYEDGYFVYPTILDQVSPNSEIAHTEIFGPVLSVMRANTVQDAIDIVNNRAYGNRACIFTSSGATARQFRYEADAGNIGINIGVAAPMAFFPGQGRHGVEFYTQTKVVVER